MDTVPKYKQLYNQIQADIMSGRLQTGTKLESELEMMDRYSCSRQTVRHALSELENRGFIEKKQGSGSYIRSRTNMPEKKTMSVLAVTPYLDDYIFPSMIKGIESVLKNNGYALSLSMTNHNIHTEAEAIKAALSKGVDGILLDPANSSASCANLHIYKMISECGIPCIFMNGYRSGIDFPVVMMDDYRGGELAAEELLHNGHRSISCFFNGNEISGSLRYEGCLSVYDHEGLLLKEENTLFYMAEEGDSLFGGESDDLILARLQGTTGIVCHNDKLALKIINLLRRNGKKVPDDYSIVSFDNSYVSVLSDIPLTTVNHLKEEIGTIAATNLLSLIKERSFAATSIQSPTLIRRDSVKKV